jgi:cell division protein FtsZ
MGVGGGGGNAVDTMIRGGFQGVDFVAANTDAQALNASLADRKVQLGPLVTQGLGAGAVGEIGRKAAEETLVEIDRMLDGVHMLFIAAGMGGGTGTGAAPVIAHLARSRGILTVGVVTKPFSFEGRRRLALADQGIEALAREVDTLIVVPNQNLFRIASPDTSFREAFKLADQVLERGVRGISDLILMPGLINLDFADVRVVMSGMGSALIGTGEACGENRALEAAEAAISNPLLDGAINGSTGLIISITGGEDMRLMEVDEAASRIKEMADPEAEIIWGSAFDPALGGRMRVSIIATGLKADRAGAPVEPAREKRAAYSEAPAPTAGVPPFDPLAADAPLLAPLGAPPEPKAAVAASTLFERMAQAAGAERRVPEPVMPPSPRERRILVHA